MSYSKKNTYAALTLLFSSYHWVMGLEIEYLTIKVLIVCKKVETFCAGMVFSLYFYFVFSFFFFFFGK